MESKKETKKGRISKKKQMKVFLWTLGFLKKYKIWFLLYLFCQLAVAVSQMLIPQFFQVFADKIVPQNSVVLFYRILISMIIVSLVLIFSMISKNHLECLLRENIGADLQRIMIEKLYELGVPYLEKTPGGVIVSLLNTDVMQTQKLYSEAFPLILTEFGIVMAAGILLVSEDVYMIVLVVLTYLLYLFFSRKLNRKVEQYLHLQTETKQTADKVVFDNLSGAEEVRVNGSREWAVDRYVNAFRNFKHVRLWSLFWRHTRASAGRIVMAAGQGIFFAYAFYGIINGALSIGQFVACNIYFSLLIQHVHNISGEFIEIQNILANTEHLYDFYLKKAVVSDNSGSGGMHGHPLAGELEFQNVSFGYEGRQRVLHNISFARPEASMEEIQEAARKAFAHEFIEKMPDGYDILVGERGVRLSGGQKQRIAIARMFLKDAQMLLIDEATSALDTVSEAYIKDALDAGVKGKTVITVAHRISTIQDYDRIYFLEKGEIREEGTFKELMEKKGAFYQMVQKGEAES